jgi:hypothetical protein
VSLLEDATPDWYYKVEGSTKEGSKP